MKSLLSLLLLCLGVIVFGEETQSIRESAQSLVQRTEGKVFRDSIRPVWLPDNERFWYRVSVGTEATEFVLVDAKTGAIRRAASLEELGLAATERQATSQLRGLKPKRTRRTGEATSLKVANKLPDSVDVFWVDTDGERRPYGRVRPGTVKEFETYAGHVWLFTNPLGNPLGFFEATATPLEIEVDGEPTSMEKSESTKKPQRSPGHSPDGKWSVRIENHNVALVDSDDQTTLLTSDGSDEHPYRGPIRWSQDSKHAVVSRVQGVKRREVTIVDSFPRRQLQPQLLKIDYAKPGDELPHVQLAIIDADQKKLQLVSDESLRGAFTERGEIDVRWSPRGHEFYFHYNQRGHQLYRVLAGDAAGAGVRTIVEERSDAFIEWSDLWHEWLDDTDELLWLSERDGWPHLWLYDVATGTVKNQITKGEWVVRDVLKVEPDKRRIWFLAGGFRDGEDPYYRQLCRVNFDGSGLVQLTTGVGDHAIEFSPTGDYFIDRWSRVDLPMVTELRDSDDGKLICELERADITQLIDSGWTMPEPFVAKGRDGETDIYGILIKPSNFDPSKKYPIVEEVYAGPHGAFTPKGFGRLIRQHVIAELGFIVVQADGMGTDERGKRFQDVCWKNLEDAGFPDRIAWIKAAASTRPWMDLSRVGIYGGSAGGQTAMRALIDHHDFYQVAVADCGCHDNRMDKIWWNEQWLGWPIDDAYLRSSNVEHAHRLSGKLLLIVGELDTNVDPASTMQVVGALQKAGKDFEFMPIVGAGHGAAETPYGSRARIDFLIKHLTTASRPRN